MRTLSARFLHTRRGMAAAVLAAAVLLVVAAGVLVTRGPATGTVALLGTTGTHADEVVSQLELRGPGVSSSVAPAHRSLALAPQLTDLGTFAVPAGRYNDLTVQVGRQSMSSQVALTVQPGSFTPVLLAVTGKRLASFVGNDRVNLGLLLTSGQVTTVPDVTFIDQGGRDVRFSSLRGRITVVGAFETHCHVSCPLYTAILSDLERTLRARGWTSRVNIAEITMDPSRDTPPVLAAYAKTTGASWELLTAPPVPLQVFWGALHTTYQDIPYTGTGTPPIDWYTGKPETHYVEHSSTAVVFDEQGLARFFLAGNPRLGHGLPQPLTRFLSPGAASQLTDPSVASWTLTDLLNRIDILMDRPDESSRAPEANLQIGARGPEFSLPSLDGGRVSLSGQLGSPTLVNFWATWCVPCRKELPLLKATAGAHPDLRILAIDEGEDRDTIRSFLRDVVGGPGQLSVLLDDDRSVGERYQVVGLPVSVFVDADGVVRSVHVGQLSDESLRSGLAALGN